MREVGVFVVAVVLDLVTREDVFELLAHAANVTAATIAITTTRGERHVIAAI